VLKEQAVFRPERVVLRRIEPVVGMLEVHQHAVARHLSVELLGSAEPLYRCRAGVVPEIREVMRHFLEAVWPHRRFALITGAGRSAPSPLTSSIESISPHGIN